MSSHSSTEGLLGGSKMQRAKESRASTGNGPGKQIHQTSVDQIHQISVNVRNMYSLKHLLNAGRKNAKEEESLGQEFGK